MRIIQITTDNRAQLKDYGLEFPYFGTAPEGLLEGFKDLPQVEIHVISCTKRKMNAPQKIAPNIWFHQPLVGRFGWGKTLFSGNVRAVRKIVREINPDIVHGQGTERDCAMAAVLSGYPNVLTIHGNMRVHAKRPENRRMAYYRMASALETFCLKKTNGVIAISRYTENLVKDFTKTWLLPNAVDSRFFKIHITPPEIPRFLVVGTICERKNSIGLIHACRELLHDGACQLAYAGDGNPSSSYMAQFNRLAQQIPNIELLGFLDRESLAKEFANSTGLILPTFEDNCPMVVLEAMAAGLPVAASNVGGVPDLIDHDKTGLLFNPESAPEITASVLSLIECSTMRTRLGTAARQHALSHFHPKVIAEQHMAIYREVLKRGRVTR